MSTDEHQPHPSPSYAAMTSPSTHSAVTAPFPLTAQSSTSTLHHMAPLSESDVELEATTHNPKGQDGIRRRSLVPASSGVDMPVAVTHSSASPRFHDEEKSINPAVTQAYQKKAQELSIRLNTLTARRKLEAGHNTAVDNPEALAADLSKLDADELETNAHFLPPEQLAALVKSDVNNGLSPQQVLENRQLYGTNMVSQAGEVSYIVLFAQQLVSGFNALLWIACIVIFLSWQPLGSLNNLIPAPVNVAVAALLLVVIFVQAGFNLYMVVGAINIVKSFSAIKLGHVKVRRGGRDVHVAAEELVVGDLVYVELGQRIPADLRLLDAHDLHVDNSALTGESELVNCTTKCTNANFMESRNMAFLGTACPQGSGVGLVVATGDQAVIGQINLMTQSENDNFSTSLHKEINRFVTIVAFAALTTGVLLCIVWGSWLYQDHRTFLPSAAFILQLISIIVAYVPEGLPITVTLTLVLIAKRMFVQNVLVRNLAIVETFNSLSLIATDKTGTLTLNKMSIVELAWGTQQRKMNPPQTVDPAKQAQGAAQMWKELDPAVADDAAFRTMVLGAALCNSASVQPGEDGTPTVFGDAADTALHNFLQQKILVDPQEYRSAYPRLSALPFNSKNKFMIVCHQLPASSEPAPNVPLPQLVEATAEPQVVCFLKGAPEIVIGRCSDVFSESAVPGAGVQEQVMSEELQKAILSRQDAMGRSGLRVIAMCRRVMPLSQFKRDFQEAQASSDNELDRIPSSQFTFVGMYGLLDPPRAEVAGAIQKAHIAGVRVAMLTGDHATTALSIARQVNIIPTEVVAEEQIHTLRLAQDSLGRAVVEIVQGGKVLNTHVLGSSSLTPDKPVAVPTSEPRTYVSRVGAYVRSSMVKKEIEPRIEATPTGAVITGNDLRLFDDFLWDWALRHRYLVFARTTPEQKLKIVREAQKRHEVVAVTGDGVRQTAKHTTAHAS